MIAGCKIWFRMCFLPCVLRALRRRLCQSVTWVFPSEGRSSRAGTGCCWSSQTALSACRTDWSSRTQHASTWCAPEDLRWVCCAQEVECSLLALNTFHVSETVCVALCAVTAPTVPDVPELYCQLQVGHQGSLCHHHHQEQREFTYITTYSHLILCVTYLCSLIWKDVTLGNGYDSEKHVWLRWVLCPSELCCGGPQHGLWVQPSAFGLQDWIQDKCKWKRLPGKTDTLIVQQWIMSTKCSSHWLFQCIFVM